MAQKENSVLLKIFEEDSTLNNPHMINHLLPVMKQAIKDSQKGDSEDLDDNTLNEVTIRCFNDAKQQLQKSAMSTAFISFSLQQQKLLHQCEALVKHELIKRGIKTLSVPAFECAKVKLLCTKISRNDGDTIKYVQLLCQVVCEAHLDGTPVDKEEYAQVQQVCKESLLLFFNILSQKQQQCAALMIMSKTTPAYYFEEIIAKIPVDAVICYDPLFSLPIGNFSIQCYVCIIILVWFVHVR